jgi:hypothetical protein
VLSTRRLVLVIFQLNGTLELLYRLCVSPLIKQELTTSFDEVISTSLLYIVQTYSLVVLWLTPLWELPHCLSECCHTLRYVAKLVLRNCELDMTKHEIAVELSGLRIVVRCTLELSHDEQYYAAVNIYRS